MWASGRSGTTPSSLVRPDPPALALPSSCMFWLHASNGRMSSACMPRTRFPQLNMLAPSAGSHTLHAFFWGKVGAVSLGSESGLLVNYYGLPSVSLRDVWFHKFARNEPGFRQRDVMCNMNHPNLLGHQCASRAYFIIFATPFKQLWQLLGSVGAFVGSGVRQYVGRPC